MPHKTNLRVLKRSRSKPRPGDIFALQPDEGLHLFGQVVLADFYGPMPHTYLIYIYDVRSPSPQPSLSELVADQLLIPPLLISQMPWTKGYFETVAHRELAGHVRAQHAFRDWNGQVVDEHANTLTGEFPQVGDYALSSCRWLDDRVSDALSIPRVPDDA